jgi:ribosomal protein S18 acetylase RimI-like enzyme
MPVFLDRLPYTGELPASFDTVGRQPYAGLGYAPDDEPAAELCAQLADTHDIVFYTDHWNMRLAGLFPKAGGEVAYFGFWETSGSLLLNQVAFEQLYADAVARGFNVVRGPLHFSTYFRYRLRVGAVPSWRQFNREPVNPPYYPGLLEQLGFAPALAFESHHLLAQDVPLVYEQQRTVQEQLHQLPFEFIPLTPPVWDALEDEIFELIQQVFSQNPAYRAVSKAQFRLLYNHAYAEGLCPHASVLFRHQPSGQLAALSLCQPNYHSLGKAISEHPIYTRDYPRLTTRTLLAKTVGVHPDFRGQGLQALLAAYAMQEFRAHYDDVIFCLMRTDNLSLRFIKNVPTEVTHYALFEREIGQVAGA